MRWLRLVSCFKLYVSFAKEPSKRNNILQKRPINLRSLLIVATPYKKMERALPKFGEATPHYSSLHAMQSTSDRKYEAHRVGVVLHRSHTVATATRAPPRRLRLPPPLAPPHGVFQIIVFHLLLNEIC